MRIAKQCSKHVVFWATSLAAGIAALTLVIVSGRDAAAQRPRLQQLLQRPLIQQALNPRLEVEVVAGQPFGVGRITVPLGDATKDSDVQTLVSVVDRRGRVLYPAYEFAPVKQLIREFISMPQRVTTIYFLFQGPEPLELTQPVASVVQPKVDAAAYDRLLRAWWREYSAKGNALVTNDSGPPVVQTYLTGMLGRRLNLPVTDPQKLQQRRSEITQAVSLLMGSDSIRDSIMQETLAGLSDGGEPANLPLPPNPPAPAIEFPQPSANANVTIEPIAMRVPEECLYVRFGNFPNFLWLQQRMESVGGDLSNFLFERAIDTGARARMEDQLCAHRGPLAQVLGPQVIDDVAFIGTDTFQAEGAAVGILFKAKNNLALGFDLTGQRSEAIKHEPTAKEEKFKLGNVTASFLATPDNRIRSFYVQDGDYHLVTNCRVIAERFVETGQGQRSLGQSAEFRYARQIAPAETDQTAFIYLSEAFQRNLLGPQYQVEMVRRLRSVAEMQLLPLARMAAAAEGVSSSSLEQLVRANLLPAGFGQRADGSRLVETKDGMIDSLRGRRGTFLPVPDVKIENITPSEARSIQRLQAAYEEDWRQMDPVLISVRRSAGPTPGVERVTVDAQAAPLTNKHFDMLSKWLGPPAQQRLAKVPGDLVWMQASVRGGTLANTGDQLLFGALRDADPAFGTEGIGAMLFKDWNARGYVGGWPQPGLLSLLGANGNVQPDANGFARLLLGQWERIYGQFTLLSFHPEVLDEVAPQLRFEQADRPAQIWLRTEDLTTSTLATKVNSFGYRRALRSSQGIARFINSFTEQLHVPQRQDVAQAESVLNAKLVDPLGGKYELLPTHSGRPLWMSTVIADPRFQGTASMPASYQFPALKWFRGMNAEVLMQPTQLVAHAEIDLPALTHAAGVDLPVLPALPSLPSFTIPGFGKSSPFDNGNGEKPSETKNDEKAGGAKAGGKPGEKVAPQPPVPGPPAPGE